MGVISGTFPSQRREVEEECRKATFFIRDGDSNKVFGRIFEFAHDRRGYGAIVLFPTGDAGFYGYDDHREEIVYLGEPPNLPKFGAMTGDDDAAHRVAIETVRTTHAVVIESNRADSIRSRISPVVRVREPAKAASARLPKPSEPTSPVGIPHATLVIK